MNLVLAFAAAAAAVGLSAAFPALDGDLEGPAREAPVIENSDHLPPWQLPMEHRRGDGLGTVVLLDTRGVTPAVYEQLGVDLFFSMWFVFLNNEVTYSGERVKFSQKFQVQ